MKLFVTVVCCMIMQIQIGMGEPIITKGMDRTSEEKIVRKLANEAYANKMGTQLMAEESVQCITPIFLGYDIPNFAQRGEMLWEARVMAFLDRELRAILWINPFTEHIHFVCGPWDIDISQ